MNSLQNNWISLIEQDKIDEAIKEFSSFLDNSFATSDIDKEISIKLLYEKLTE